MSMQLSTVLRGSCVVASVLAFGCGGSEPASTTPAAPMPSAPSTVAPTSASEPATSDTAKPAAAKPPADAAPSNATMVVKLDPMKGELPEGLAIRGDTMYVGLFPLFEVRKVDKAGAVTPFGSVPKVADQKGYVAGVELDKAGNVYVALTSFDPKVQAGIYKIPAAGGEGKVFGKAQGFVAPNGLDFDDKGNLFATDSVGGTIFKITPQGKTTKFASDPALMGDKASCGGLAPFVIGANGIGHDSEGNIWVVNSDKGSLVKVPVGKDGKAGKVETVIAPDCSLHGADGLTVDSDGSIVVALNVQNTVVRITPKDKKVTPLLKGAPLDFPASVYFGSPDGTRALYITNFALMNAQAKKEAHPGVVKFAL